MTDNLPDATAEALHRAVRDLGRRVGESPDRVRAVLSDALGVTARDHRSEIDAIALASEEGVPATLVGREDSVLTESDVALDDTRLRSRLVERGLSDGAADYAISAWASALGSVTSLSVTGGLTSAGSGVGGGSLSDPATELPAALPPEAAAEGQSEGATGILGFPVAAERPASRRHVLHLGRRAMAGAAAAVLAIVGAVAWFSTTGDDPTRTVLADSALRPAPTSTTSAITTTAPPTTGPAVTTRPTRKPTTTPTKKAATTKTAPARPSSTTPKSTTRPKPTSSSTPVKTASATKKPAPPPPPPPAPKTLVAGNSSASWTPQFYETGINQCVDFVPPHAANNVCQWRLNVVKKGTVTTWSISSAQSVQGHGSVSIDGKTILYKPHHNGYFTDTVKYRLTGSGVTSNWGYISITVYCNQQMTCY
ncbi:hypothetical protein SAMN04489867_2260 [Pedococcus dokdonensis]|uniref:Uncharacterized protein n=1 Tax=Pedococcus dokdonensis TaxID=443156 RepID=A0A1H0S9B4_9MICO|nr:hypothetical protein [Pedococcus dokdonensis]SDP38363.1 hypothetical protein SAMN04489867_2260 [Pedococcus dokdonensis]